MDFNTCAPGHTGRRGQRQSHLAALLDRIAFSYSVLAPRRYAVPGLRAVRPMAAFRVCTPGLSASLE